ncbi:MAG: glycosyltransferase [Chloroflexota bacterium]
MTAWIERSMDAVGYLLSESDMLIVVSTQDAPDEIVRLATQRAEARAARQWQAADHLREAIESAGWRVVDSGTEFSLAPTRPADLVERDRTLYGGVESVPSRLAEPASLGASVTVVAHVGDDTLAETLARLKQHCPDDTQCIVVADGAIAIDSVRADVETVWTVGSFDPGAALQAGLRRASGNVIVVMQPDRVPDGDVVSPLVSALDDGSVAIVGPEGLRSSDLRRFQLAPIGDVTALRPGCYAFRRSEAIARGPFDERLRLASSVAAWWSLVLRDEGHGAVPRRAVAMRLPLEDRPRDWTLRDGHARLLRRDAYRIAERFGHRSDLAAVIPGDHG